MAGIRNECMPVVRGMLGVVNTADFEQLETYWRSLQASSQAAIPFRSQFNPAAIVRVLPHIYLLERRSPVKITIRICGTALDAISGVTTTGQNYLDICPPQERGPYAKLAHIIFSQPCAAKLERDVTFANGNTHRLASSIFPLADAEGMPRFLVGLMKPHRLLRRDELGNGAVLRAELRELAYVDIGFGVPDASRPATTVGSNPPGNSPES